MKVSANSGGKNLAQIPAASCHVTHPRDYDTLQSGAHHFGEIVPISICFPCKRFSLQYANLKLAALHALNVRLIRLPLFNWPQRIS